MIKFKDGMTLIPMQSEANSDKFAHANAGTWAYALDGKKHGKIPAIVLPGLEYIWGGESAIRKAGYRKHWLVFEDPETGRITFGNYRSFIEGTPEDRAIASEMMVVSIEELEKL